MSKFEIKIIDFIQKHVLLIGITILTIISLKIRYSLFQYTSQDYNDYLIMWYTEIKGFGGFSALKYNIGNYTTPYMLILTILTYIPKSPLIMIKLVSVFFDYICAITGSLIVSKLFINSKFQKRCSALTYTIIIFLPTIILNSSYWGQCDSIYTSFVLLTILMLIKEQYPLAFVLFGIAISFKLQAIFILPLIIILYLANKKFSILNFILIPITFIFTTIPSLVMGNSLKNIFEIYISQTNQYEYLSLNYPNIYTFIMGKYIYFQPFGIYLTIAILGILTIIIIYNKWEIKDVNILSIALLTSYICLYFLPSMHERYGYILDILSVVYVLIKWNQIYISISVNFISIVSYMVVLHGGDVFNWQIIALVNGIILIILFILTMEDLKNSNTKINSQSYQESRQ